MKKNGAIWVALVVVAVAALLMYFVVLPLSGGKKTINDLAKTASETMDKASDTAQKTIDKVVGTADQAKDATKTTVATPVADPKADVLQKMARVKTDSFAAVTAFGGLFTSGNLPTAEQLAAARGRLEDAFRSASELKAPDGLDTSTATLVSTLSGGASKALAAIKAMPTDVAGAQKAFIGLKDMLTAAANGVALPAVVSATKNETTDNEATPADDGMPSFDVLRVEKDGSTVIAGKAAPGTKIDLLDGDKVIASADAGASGDFVIVLDNPLAVGDHQLTLRATASDGKVLTSSEVATVSVPADKSGELLAMVTKPGEPSRIMEMPTAKQNTVVAANDVKAVEPAAKTPATDTSIPADPAKTVATPALPDASSELTSVAPVVNQKAADVEADKTADAIKPADNPSADATAEAVKPADQTDNATPAKATSDDASKTVKEATQPEVLVNAVEIEGDKIFVAGSTRPNATVRVYADDKLVAEVQSDKNGRFVADNRLPLAVGEHRIRADVLSRDGKRVAFRASVPFFRPEGAQLAAVAGDTAKPDTSKMQPLADGEYDKAREEASKAVSLLKGLYDAGRTPKLDELAAARSATEIALKTLAQIKLSGTDDPVAKEMADNTADKAAKALALLKSLPTDAGSVKTALDSIDDAVTSAVAPSMQTASANKNAASRQTPVEKQADAAKSSNTNVAETTTSQPAKQTAAKQTTDVASADANEPKTIEQAPLKPSDNSSVIIRRGDTLWQISRRVYGRGVRYTTIYLANEDQINNPDRILPGQIFGVPEKYLPNSEELHRERVDHKKHGL